MWQCIRCYREFERLQIAWGTSGGTKVGVLDFFCPHCGNSGSSGERALVFIGTKEGKNAYWNKEWSGGFDEDLSAKTLFASDILEHCTASRDEINKAIAHGKKIHFSDKHGTLTAYLYEGKTYVTEMPPPCFICMCEEPGIPLI